MSPNPNPARVTDAQWWLCQQLLALAPGSAIGGVYAFKPGYHSTRRDNEQNWKNNYSIVDEQDRRGPADKAAAFDWTFPDAQRGDYRTIARYTKRIIDSGRDPDDERLDGWREFYGNADSDDYVEGWDARYLEEVTSDSSHLWHIHGSENRSEVESFQNKDALLSVLRGETVQQWRDRTTQGDDMALTDDDATKVALAVWRTGLGPVIGASELRKKAETWLMEGRDAAVAANSAPALSGEQVEALADRIVSALAGQPATVDAVKRALREGTG